MNRDLGHQVLKPNLQKGFTLLEVVFVLGMIGIIVTWITLGVATVETEQRLRDASGDIVAMVGKARSIAVRQQRSYQVIVTADKVLLQPEFFNEDDSFDEEELNDDEARVEYEDVTDSKGYDSDVEYEIQRWQSDNWLVMEEKNRAEITVNPTGLVEPISIRCSYEDSWLIQRLHPLTGSVREEEMTIQE